MVSKSKILADWLSEMPTRGREKEGGGKHNGGDDTMRRLKALLKDY